jgi:hypothetical protein
MMLVFLLNLIGILKLISLRSINRNQFFFFKMARAMFEYTKIVLKKVSFNSDLFYIELEKALKRLLPHEVEELTIWIKQFTVNKPELSTCLSLIQ